MMLFVPKFASGELRVVLPTLLASDAPWGLCSLSISVVLGMAWGVGARRRWPVRWPTSAASREWFRAVLQAASPAWWVESFRRWFRRPITRTTRIGLGIAGLALAAVVALVGLRWTAESSATPSGAAGLVDSAVVEGKFQTAAARKASGPEQIAASHVAVVEVDPATWDRVAAHRRHTGFAILGGFFVVVILLVAVFGRKKQNRAARSGRTAL
jgi:hypothetical protein